ncbi:MAG: hypothetical protein EXS08_01355 [Planctomycetes bacterium]|nr:hypothetical protein [Planctomycetota bacterium]
MEMLATLSLSPASSLLAALAALCAPACERDGASLVAEQGEAQFGRVFEGSLLEHDWTLRVVASATVSASKTDCGCTLAKLEREGPAGPEVYAFGTPLAAGDRLRVRASYDTRGKRGSTRRAVTLSLADGSFLALALTADVQPWLVLEPREFSFLRLTEGTGAERDFAVRSAAGEAFLLHATRVALPPWVKLELQADGPDAQGRAAAWRGRVTLGAEAPRGTYSYPLELESDVPVPGPISAGGTRHFSVSPSWTLQIVGPVALSTPTLEFGLVRADETVSRTVRLESFELGFSVAKAKARLEPLHEGDAFPLARTAHVNLRPGVTVTEIELTLGGLAAEVNGTFLGRLVVETGHPKLPELQALVRGLRAPEVAGR